MSRMPDSLSGEPGASPGGGAIPIVLLSWFRLMCMPALVFTQEPPSEGGGSIPLHDARVPGAIRPTARTPDFQSGNAGAAPAWRSSFRTGQRGRQVRRSCKSEHAGENPVAGSTSFDAHGSPRQRQRVECASSAGASIVLAARSAVWFRRCGHFVLGSPAVGNRSQFLSESQRGISSNKKNNCLTHRRRGSVTFIPLPPLPMRHSFNSRTCGLRNAQDPGA